MCKSYCLIEIRDKTTSKTKHYEMVALKLALAIWLVRIELDCSVVGCSMNRIERYCRSFIRNFGLLLLFPLVQWFTHIKVSV